MTFVVVEGPEGAGKSTLVRWLGTTLRAEGREVLMVREPGGMFHLSDDRIKRALAMVRRAVVAQTNMRLGFQPLKQRRG